MLIFLYIYCPPRDDLIVVQILLTRIVKLLGVAKTGCNWLALRRRAASEIGILSSSPGPAIRLTLLRKMRELSVINDLLPMSCDTGMAVKYRLRKHGLPVMLTGPAVRVSLKHWFVDELMLLHHHRFWVAYLRATFIGAVKCVVFVLLQEPLFPLQSIELVIVVGGGWSRGLEHISPHCIFRPIPVNLVCFFQKFVKRVLMPTPRNLNLIARTAQTLVFFRIYKVVVVELFLVYVENWR
jgi:hypothetical protein